MLRRVSKGALSLSSPEGHDLVFLERSKNVIFILLSLLTSNLLSVISSPFFLSTFMSELNQES